MFYVIDHNSSILTNFDERVAGHILGEVHEARDAIVKAASLRADNSSSRITVYERDTNRTIAGPGYLGNTRAGSKAGKNERATLRAGFGPSIVRAATKTRKAAQRAFMASQKNARRQAAKAKVSGATKK